MRLMSTNTHYNCRCRRRAKPPAPAKAGLGFFTRRAAWSKCKAFHFGLHSGTFALYGTHYILSDLGHRETLAGWPSLHPRERWAGLNQLCVSLSLWGLISSPPFPSQCVCVFTSCSTLWTEMGDPCGISNESHERLINELHPATFQNNEMEVSMHAWRPLNYCSHNALKGGFTKHSRSLHLIYRTPAIQFNQVNIFFIFKYSVSVPEISRDKKGVSRALPKKCTTNPLL